MKNKIQITIHRSFFLICFLLLLSGSFFVWANPVSAATEVSGLISTEQVWTKAQSPYVIPNAGLHIKPPGKIIIEPGVVVKLDTGAQFWNEGGILKAIGTPAEPIIFTALTDDSVAGDTNSDGAATTPTAGYWFRLLVTTGGENQFIHTEIRYGAKCINSAFTSPIITDNLIHHCINGIDLAVADSSIQIEHNIIRNNETGILGLSVPGVIFSQNNIYDNSSFGAQGSSAIMNGINNWWGHPSGPYHPTLNPQGQGNAVSDGILFDPWLGQPVEPPESQIDPVIIIPGILGSFPKNGEWVLDPVFKTFNNLFDTLRANGYKEGTDLFGFPYDWTRSNELTAFKLKDKIDEIKQICNCAKVDLVVHSMGGLAAREYIQSNYYEDDVDQLIFLGTPHLGSPKAYLTWEGGEFGVRGRDFWGKIYFALLAKKYGYTSVFEYVRNWPVESVEELLPIYDYLKNKDSLMLRSYPNNYPQNHFLEHLDINIDRLLNSGVRITNIVGEVMELNTINWLRVVPSNYLPLWEHGYPEGFYNIFIGDRGILMGSGDETVPSYSAQRINIDQNIILSKHEDLPTKAQAIIYKKLTGRDATEIIDINYSMSTKLLLIGLLSPVDMLIISPDGKRIGKDFSTNQEVNEIDGAFYSGFLTDDEFITIPNPLDGEYQIITQGTDNGGEYTVITGYITEDKLIETEFTGQTSPNLIQELELTLDNNNPESLEITPEITPESIISDIQNFYSQGQITKEKVKDHLIKKLHKIIELKVRLRPLK